MIDSQVLERVPVAREMLGVPAAGRAVITCVRVSRVTVNVSA